MKCRLFSQAMQVPGGGGVTPHMKGVGMPKGDRSGRGPSSF